MELNECIYGRRSVRSYKGGEISRQELVELIKAANMAPSWKNSQTPRYYIVSEQKESFFECLADFNKPRVKNASAFLVSCVKKGISGYDFNGNATHLGNGFECFDNGLAIQNLCLKAYEMGISTLIMGLYERDKIAALLEIPDELEIVTVVALGYADEDPSAPRRKSVEEIAVFK